MSISSKPRERTKFMRHFYIKVRSTDEKLKFIATTFGNATAKAASSRMHTSFPLPARHMPHAIACKVPEPMTRCLAQFKDPLWSNEN